MSASIQTRLPAGYDGQASPASTSADQPGSRLAMLEELQSTLDLNALTRIILRQVNCRVTVEGLLYTHESLHISASAGRAATHSCGYRLVVPEEQLGELTFRRDHPFQAHELAGLEALLALFINPLRNALRFRLAVDASYRDSGSGAHNTRSLWQILPREIALARRHNRPLCALLLDISDLPLISSRHGRSGADAVRRTLVDRVMAQCRDTDLLFCVEDNTFLLLLQETSDEGARQSAQRIRQSVGSPAVEHEGMVIPFSLVMEMLTASGTDSAVSFIDRGLRALKARRAVNR